MRKFKTLLTATIVSALALSSLAACSSDESNTEETTKATTQSTTQATTIATVTPKETSTGITCPVVDYYYGVDVGFTTDLASEDVAPDYVDSDSEDSKVILFTPDDSISEIVYTGITSEPDGDWYNLTSCPEELAFIDSADKDNPIAIQMEAVDGNPTRAFQYKDSEESYHLALIHYDSAADEFCIRDVRAAG